jgi:hypothetical protein
MINVGTFVAIWYNLWPFGIIFGIVCGHLVYFSQFGMFGRRKIWQPCSKRFKEEPSKSSRAYTHHRNLSTRTSMFALVQQTFLAKKDLVKSLLISTLHRQGNLLHWNIFTGLYKTSLYNTK